uniref:Uncharacterized protein n=1 Tax=Anas platyrhynchos platyrhynchos TaxID=8840 RepID=A0A493TP07_ANAPP
MRRRRRGTAAPRPPPPRNRVIAIVFLALFIDLLGFALILPLFPSILDYYSRTQDGLYLSLQHGVDWFAEMVGMPPGRKYNSVLFGGMEFKQLKQNLHCFQVICNVVRNDEEIDKK